MIWQCHQLIAPKPITDVVDGDMFEYIMQLEGKVYRDVPGRRTLRVNIGGKHYFAKLHFGVGWPEIFKNFLSMKRPVVSAWTEWQAIQRLNELGIHTTPGVAYGCQGSNPASYRSFILTDDLGDIISLEDFCRDWKTSPPELKLKRLIMNSVAEIARTIHDNGLNHRDFYICHFCLDGPRLASGEVLLYLIDLHRMQVRQKLPTSARMKDMAALYFSALDIGLTKMDCLRFLRQYRNQPLKQILKKEADFWKTVEVRARKLYFKFHGRWPATTFDEVNA